MFRLTKAEKAELVAKRDQLAGLKYSKTLPSAFTEHGAIMAASALNSQRAVELSVFVVRAFVKLRRVISEHKELAHRLTQLERRLADHDEQILALVQAIRKLLGPGPAPKKRRIGFRVENEP